MSKDIYSIYKISNLVNNKPYIGFTSKSIQERLQRHFTDSKRKNKPLYAAGHNTIIM